MIRTMFISLTLLSLLFLPATASLGVTHSNDPQQPVPPECIVAGMQTLKFTSLRLEEPDHALMSALLHTNATIFLTIPNDLVTAMANNRSVARAWLHTHVVPFHPHVNITTISVGNAFLDAYGHHPQCVIDLLKAIFSVYMFLRDLSIHEIAVSTSFSFYSAIDTPFPPSAAVFRSINLMSMLLPFLNATNSPFLIDLQPVNIYRPKAEIPLGFALFQQHAFNFHEHIGTGLRYWNLFDMMVDAVASAMASSGYNTIPIVFTETEWPSFHLGEEFAASLGCAEIYLRGLVKHLRSQMGMPLLKNGLPEVYLYELFDEEETTMYSDWGILYPNGTPKYRVDFSSSSRSR